MTDKPNGERQRILLGKVVGIQLYANDAVVIREGNAPETEGHERSEIMEFSRKSRLRLAFVASNTPVRFRTMITLTYPKEYPCDGTHVKAHLREFIHWLRKDTHGCDYLWFLEFQARGAPHFHILIDWPLPSRMEVRRGFRFRCSSVWYAVVGSRDEKHLAAGTRVERLRKPDGAARYAIKYAWKMKQKTVPPNYRNVGRFWGHSARVKPLPQAELRCTEDDIRGALEGWEYAPDGERALFRVLYNQAARFGAYCTNQLDNSSKQMYNGSKNHSPEQAHHTDGG